MSREVERCGKQRRVTDDQIQNCTKEAMWIKYAPADLMLLNDPASNCGGVATLEATAKLCCSPPAAPVQLAFQNPSISTRDLNNDNSV